jgi:type I restriction enzyme S subunit
MKVNFYDVVDVISGGTPRTDVGEFWNGEIPWLSVVDFAKSVKYVYDTEKHITELGLKNSNTKLLNIDDIIISARGTVGAIAMLKIPMAFNQSCFGLRAKREFMNQDYLFYFLKYYMENLKKKTQGSVFSTINLETFRMIDFELPDTNTQIKISKILSCLDSKIENNNKINAELESMAKTLYDYWFLQFEFPNENGKPYKSSGGKMVWNEELKREIPEGWKVDNLIESSLCEDIKAGVDYFETKNYLPTANINGEEITDGDYITFNNRESRANMQPVKNSVWFAKMKNSIKHLTIPENSDWFISKYILSTGFQGLKCSADSLAYIHCLINSDWFEKYKDVLSHGATQESVNNEDLKNIKFAVPTQEILKRFAEIVNPIIEKKFQIIKENQELVSLRDFLLPLLMNGQVKFKDN